MQTSASGEDGAVMSFVGRVRADRINDKIISMIEFSAQQPASEQIAQNLISYCINKFKINSAEVRHSVGCVAVGEACFAVVVKAGHRKEGFKALPFLVDGIKKNCPIFGKEIFNGGEYQWKKNT